MPATRLKRFAKEGSLKIMNFGGERRDARLLEVLRKSHETAQPKIKKKKKKTFTPPTLRFMGHFRRGGGRKNVIEAPGSR